MEDKDKHVVITGVSRGLGKELALGFAKLGWSVSGYARSAQGVRGLANEISGEKHLLRAVDVLDKSGVAEFKDEVVSRFGSPDLLINNAAVINRNSPLWELSESEFEEVIDVNLKGVFYMIRQFLPSMIDNGSGVVVNLSSGWGRSTSPDVAPYCCTKFGIEGLSLSLAQELPSGLACVALNPGIIDTDMLKSTFGEGSSSFRGASEWAQTAVPFLANLSAKDNGGSLTAP